DLRREVREMMQAGRTDAEIRQFMIERYGDFVLYRPRLNATNFLLWAAPALCVSFGGAPRKSMRTTQGPGRVTRDGILSRRRRDARGGAGADPRAVAASSSGDDRGSVPGASNAHRRSHCDRRTDRRRRTLSRHHELPLA